MDGWIGSFDLDGIGIALQCDAVRCLASLRYIRRSPAFLAASYVGEKVRLQPLFEPT